MTLCHHIVFLFVFLNKYKERFVDLQVLLTFNVSCYCGRGGLALVYLTLNGSNYCNNNNNNNNLKHVINLCWKFFKQHLQILFQCILATNCLPNNNCNNNNNNNSSKIIVLKFRKNKTTKNMEARSNFTYFCVLAFLRPKVFGCVDHQNVYLHGGAGQPIFEVHFSCTSVTSVRAAVVFGEPNSSKASSGYFLLRPKLRVPIVGIFL